MLFRSRSLEASKKPVDTDLQFFLSQDSLMISAANGPLWYRGYAEEPENGFSAQIDQILSRFGARSVVVSHTIPASRRITPRFQGRVFLIDTGMLTPYFQGRPSALEISGSQRRAIYVGEPAQPLGSDSK